MTQSYAEKDYSAQLCGYLCVPLRLKKAALQVEPNPQKGASGNASEKEPEIQGGVGRGGTAHPR